MATNPTRVTVGVSLEAHAAAQRLVELVEREGWGGIGLEGHDARISIAAVIAVAVEALERNVTSRRALVAAFAGKKP